MLIKWARIASSKALFIAVISVSTSPYRCTLLGMTVTVGDCLLPDCQRGFPVVLLFELGAPFQRSSHPSPILTVLIFMKAERLWGLISTWLIWLKVFQSARPCMFVDSFPCKPGRPFRQPILFPLCSFHREPRRGLFSTSLHCCAGL